jgi:cytochrome c nitrite reductase small subunit
MTIHLKNPKNGSPKLWLWVSGLVIGSIITVGAGVGMQITDKRPFCASCHIMNEAAVTHKISSHAELACNECHAPHNLLEKLPFKAVSGTRDMYMNTLGKIEMPLKAGESTRQVVNTNCKACHRISNTTVASMDAKGLCTDCHRNVQHMRMKPVSTRSVGDV